MTIARHARVLQVLPFLLLAACNAQSAGRSSGRMSYPAVDAATVQADDIARFEASKPTAVVRYGFGDRQFGELRVPAGAGPFPVAMIVHGGCFVKGFATQSYMAPMATRLTEAGIATWNIDYRELGDDGAGWPGTFNDFATAAAKLSTLAKRYPLDLDKVTVIGHSAGMTAASFLAAGPKTGDGLAIAAGIPRFRGAVLMDGWPDLGSAIGFDKKVCGRPVMLPLLGGTPADHPARYAMTSVESWPIQVDALLVGGALMDPALTARTAAAIKAKGGKAEALDAPSHSHFGMVAPGSSDYRLIEPKIIALVKAP